MLLVPTNLFISWKIDVCNLKVSWTSKNLVESFYAIAKKSNVYTFCEGVATLFDYFVIIWWLFGDYSVIIQWLFIKLLVINNTKNHSAKRVVPPPSTFYLIEVGSIMYLKNLNVGSISMTIENRRKCECSTMDYLPFLYIATQNRIE